MARRIGFWACLVCAGMSLVHLAYSLWAPDGMTLLWSAAAIVFLREVREAIK
jgi:hypothetical protein